MRRLTLLLIAVVTTAATLLYATRLGYVPPSLLHDETQFALQAASVASTGRDLGGRLLPVFFAEPGFPAGRDPALIYLTAATLTWLPFSEANVRLPIALLGVVNVVLMFLLVRRVFGRDWMAVVAAVFMALTPLHFIRSRLILSPQSSIPIILVWLLCIAALSERVTTRRLALASAWLAFGVYTYLACVVMMPIYWLLTAWFGYRQLGRRAVVIAAVAFVLPLVPMAIWYVTHPERMSQVVGAYELGNEAATNGTAFGAGFDAVRKAVRLYWSFFSPEFQFVSGDSSLINSTRLSGLFPLSFAVLIPLGLLQLVKTRRSIEVAILAGWLTAPVAAVASGAIEMNRILFVIPFGVLAAVYGVEWLVTIKSRSGVLLALLLIAAVPLQFVVFYNDYMGPYRTRAATAFGGNTRELFISAIERTAVNGSQQVYVSRAIPFADRYWRLHALAEKRPDAIERMQPYGPELPERAPAGTLLACPLNSTECSRLLPGDQGWMPVNIVNELDGTPAYALFEAR
jgi:4-amino-4-deoxy-L-arabinose transferase-like glycosyltransferase